MCYCMIKRHKELLNGLFNVWETQKGYFNDKKTQRALESVIFMIIVRVQTKLEGIKIIFRVQNKFSTQMRFNTTLEFIKGFQWTENHFRCPDGVTRFLWIPWCFSLLYVHYCHFIASTISSHNMKQRRVVTHKMILLCHGCSASTTFLISLL